MEEKLPKIKQRFLSSCFRVPFISRVFSACGYTSTLSHLGAIFFSFYFVTFVGYRKGDSGSPRVDMTLTLLGFILAALVHLGGCYEVDDYQPYLRYLRESQLTKPMNPLWKSTSTDKLKQDLLQNYDKFARPMQHGNKTSVIVEPAIRHIELDERRSIMIIHCWMKMVWEDGKLKWDPGNYNGLKELHLADHEVWQPDVLPYNSATGSTIDHYGNTNLIAFNNGTVIWVPPSIFHVFCPLDFTQWPFDTQSCNLKIGSWTYNGEQVDLFNDYHNKTIYEMENLIPNSEWDFVSMKVERNKVFYSCCPVPYVDLTFYLTVKRHSATYKALIITPATVVVLMTLATFWLPATSGDKITLGGAAVVIVCLFILYFTQKMPVMAGHIPHIVTFYSRCLYLASFAILIAVLMINLARNPKASPLPWSIKRVLTGWPGKCLLIKYPEERNLSKAEEMADSQPVLSEQARQLSESCTKNHQQDWILLAMAIDRIFFILYCLAFIFLALIYSV